MDSSKEKDQSNSSKIIVSMKDKRVMERPKERVHIMAIILNLMDSGILRNRKVES